MSDTHDSQFDNYNYYSRSDDPGPRFDNYGSQFHNYASRSDGYDSWSEDENGRTKSVHDWMELRLTGVPIHMSAYSLKKGLQDKYLRDQCEFSVTLQGYSEDLFWKLVHRPRMKKGKKAKKTRKKRKNRKRKRKQHRTKLAAQVFIRRFNDPQNAKVNPGDVLTKRRNISIKYHYGTARLQVELIKRQKVSKSQLYRLSRENFQPGLQQGRIGYIRNVSCGSFDENCAFETACTWPYGSGLMFRELWYLDDASPPKFRILLPSPQNRQRCPPMWEWMDLHEANIQGLIFTKPEDENLGVVYFVLDKAPQFYRRTAVTNVKSRISYPSNLQVHRDDDIDVCGVPWIIQHSRVFKVEYKRLRDVDLSANSFRKRRPGQEPDDILCVWAPEIAESERTANDMANTIRINLEKISKMPHLGIPGSQLGVLKLLYNCNVAATSPEATRLIDHLTSFLSQNDSQHLRIYTENLNKMAKDMETSHNRALRAVGSRSRESLFQRSEAGRRYLDLTKRIRDTKELERQKSHSTISVAQRHSLSVAGPSKSSLERNNMSAHGLTKEGALSYQKYFSLFPSIARYTHLDEECLEVRKLERHGLRSPSSPGVFEVLVYPSHIEIEGPIDIPTSSVADQYRDYIGRFIRVKFVDNNRKPLKVEPGISLGGVLEQRVVRVLTNQNLLFPQLPHLREFEFLGYSMSSLKKRKAVWFFQRQGSLDAKTIRDWIGDWDVTTKPNINAGLAHHPSKWGARMSLAFTESIPVVSLIRTEWTIRPDHVAGEYPQFPNTDGCGLISQELCGEINRRLAERGLAASQAFQIRFGGVKGVVYAGPNSLLTYEGKHYKMLLRKSQHKLQVPNSDKLELRVVSAAVDSPQSLFFMSALKAFEDSGANIREIIEIYRRAHRNLMRTSKECRNLLTEIFRSSQLDNSPAVEARYGFLKLAIELRRLEWFSNDDLEGSFLGSYLTKLAAKTLYKDPFKIPIPGSFSLLGLTDDYQFLKCDEVFIRARGKTIEGPVLLYRDPIIHIGDIQKATAVAEKELYTRITKSIYQDSGERIEALLSMDHVIFFSQKDDPPLPNRLSGGDLDGDRFEVLTKDCGFWDENWRTSDPDSYTGDGTSAAAGGHKPFDIDGVAKFVGQYIQNDCFEELQNRHLALAEEKLRGMNDPDVQAMAPWLSKAVDYAKSGEAVDLIADVEGVPKFRFQAMPNFLRATSHKVDVNGRGEHSHPRSLLETIYRNFDQHKEHVLELVTRSNYGRYNNEMLIKLLRREWDGDLAQIRRSECIRGDIIDDLLKDVRHRALQGLQGYRESNDSLGLVGGERESEVDLFLRKQRDDFPSSTLNNIMQLAIEAMAGHDIVIIDHSSVPPLKARPQNEYRPGIVRCIYNHCLVEAWYEARPLAIQRFVH
ncbi:hypothetical protein ABW21_db0203522 [Orbilia brochopaga]|nr:hypothetical protein ABW21_db0203522 [Drechslerella brochopaga]